MLCPYLAHLSDINTSWCRRYDNRSETGCTSFCPEADAVYLANIWYELLGNRTLLVKVTNSIEEEQDPGLEQKNNALRYALCVPAGAYCRYRTARAALLLLPVTLQT